MRINYENYIYSICFEELEHQQTLSGDHSFCYIGSTGLIRMNRDKYYYMVHYFQLIYHLD